MLKEKVLTWFKNQKENYGLMDIKIDIAYNTELINEDRLYKSLWSMIEDKASGNYKIIAESD